MEKKKKKLRSEVREEEVKRTGHCILLALNCLWQMGLTYSLVMLRQTHLNLVSLRIVLHKFVTLLSKGRDSSALHYCQILSEVNERQLRWNFESCEGKENSCKTLFSHSFDQQFHR